MARTVQVTKFKVTGMHCSSCSTAVQKALSVTSGVEKASVSLTLEQAEVVYDPNVVHEVITQCLRINHLPPCNCSSDVQSLNNITAHAARSSYCFSLT